MTVEEANDDGADPTRDINSQNKGQGSPADSISKDDPHKTEKLASGGDGGDKAEATE